MAKSNEIKHLTAKLINKITSKLTSLKSMNRSEDRLIVQTECNYLLH